MLNLLLLFFVGLTLFLLYDFFVLGNFRKRFGTLWLVAGFAFLYVPIFVLIVLSFNESKLVTVWSSFSFKWYGHILQDDELIDGLRVSLKVAMMTATASVILGTLMAYVMVRYRKFTGRTLFVAHINAPLVVPEVITGLSLLLFFVSLERAFDWPQRGVLTIFIGHVSFCASFAAVIISSRLVSMDRSLEEAAMDLGARPLQVFFLVTLPSIAQSLVSAWLLTFTLSLDNVVTSAFLNGPESTTLPIVLFSRARLGLDPTVNAVATITVVVVGIGVLGGSLWMARQERKRSLEQSLALRAEAT